MQTKKVYLKNGFADGAYAEIDEKARELFRNEGVFDPKDPRALNKMKASLYVKSDDFIKDQEGMSCEIFKFVKANIPFSEWSKY